MNTEMYCALCDKKFRGDATIHVMNHYRLLDDENKRLRSALEKIAKSKEKYMCVDCSDMYEGNSPSYEARIAKAALGNAQTEEGV